MGLSMLISIIAGSVLSNYYVVPGEMLHTHVPPSNPRYDTRSYSMLWDTDEG